jgi:hypothetical protein
MSITKTVTYFLDNEEHVEGRACGIREVADDLHQVLERLKGEPTKKP